jgi:hypothetical protein
MKAAIAVAFAFALFASTGSVLAQEEERSTTQSDSFASEGGGTESEREGLGRACTTQEWVAADFHCDAHHAPSMMNCHLTSCVVRNGWIVYSWNGYYFG